MNETSAVSDLIAYARVWDSDAVEASPGKARHMIQTLADALEAAEVELARRDTASQVDRYALADALMHVYDHGTSPNALREADAIILLLAAAPVSLEAVKAETTTEWATEVSIPDGDKARSEAEPQCMTTHGTHAEMCGPAMHYHGRDCSYECPTCGGLPLWDTNHLPAGDRP